MTKAANDNRFAIAELLKRPFPIAKDEGEREILAQRIREATARADAAEAERDFELLKLAHAKRHMRDDDVDV